MIKRTLHFGNPAYLNLRQKQLDIHLPEQDKKASVPIEDIGVMILDHPQINITHAAIAALLENNVALITCDKSHLPTGMMLPLDGNSLQNERFRAQLSASEPLKKQIWQQTVQSKIRNQAALLKKLNREGYHTLMAWANEVKSGDSENHEARAAAYYWPRIFEKKPQFFRRRGGDSPNHWLNYGYAILRAIVARNLTGSGLLPTLGVFHANKYNAYCLADDIMEPYRPYVDQLVNELLEKYGPSDELDKDIKAHLLQIPVLDVEMNKEKRPLLIAVQHTTAQLVRVFEGESRKMHYPNL